MTFVLADAAGIVGAAVGAAALVLTAIGLIVRFRPKFDVAIDERRQAIRVNISNRGRLEGRINEVSILGSGDLEIPSSEFEGLPNGKFHSGRISRKEARSLVIKAEKEKAFPEGIRVFVKWGLRGKNEILPRQETDISYYGERGSWPPVD